MAACKEVKSPASKDVPFEGLKLDRNRERCINSNQDLVKEGLGKDTKCQWSYSPY